MKPGRRPRVYRAAILASGVLFIAQTGDALSQTARTIKLVVPFPAGSPSDVLSRVLAEEIGRVQGPTMVVENRPGASTSLAAEVVARAAPDGGTLLIATTALVINPHLRATSHDPLTVFEPICNLASSPTVLVVDGASPHRSLGALLEAARAKPGALTVAGAGPASTVHIAFEMMKRAAKVDMTFVPYPGPPPAISALLGGHVSSIFVPYPAVEAHLKTGRLRAIAVSTLTRIAALPDVPTIAEAGYQGLGMQGLGMDVWFGVVAPAKTPDVTVRQLANWFSAALQAPEVGSKLAQQGLYPIGICGAEFREFLRKRLHEYGIAIRDANIKAE